MACGEPQQPALVLGDAGTVSRAPVTRAVLISPETDDPWIDSDNSVARVREVFRQRGVQVPDHLVLRGRAATAQAIREAVRSAMAGIPERGPEDRLLVYFIGHGAYERDLDWTARRYGHPHRKAVFPLIDAQGGVRLSRSTPKTVMLGVRGAWKETPSEFEEHTITKAVYATAWDGHVVVEANANGWLEVRTER